MNYISIGFIVLWSTGLQTKGKMKKDLSEYGFLRLMGGANRCEGGLEMNLHNTWKPVDDLSFGWNLRISDTVCKQLGCGSAVSAKIKDHQSSKFVWKINISAVWSDSASRKYLSMKPQHSFSSVELTCSEYVRLVNGTTLCSGKVEVRADQLWSTKCEGDFDMQDAEVVCRDLGCGTPSKIHTVGHENIETRKWRCRKNESTLPDCDSYESARNTCSPVGLTCSDPDNVRLMEGGSRCAGRLEMKLSGHWKPVDGSEELVKSGDFICRQLKCGSAVSTKINTYSSHNSVWGIISSRVKSVFTLREFVSLRPWFSATSLEVACSDLLYQPLISISPSSDWVYKYSTFTITCSIQPQYPGGIFKLTILATSYTTQTYTETAVNHSARFLFPAADRAHQGNYSCVYHVYVFSHDFYSRSQTLSLSVTAFPVVFFSRLLGLVLIFALFLGAICFHKKATRGQETWGQGRVELDTFSLYDSRAEDGLHGAAVSQESTV